MRTNSSAVARTISPSIPGRPNAEGFVLVSQPPTELHLAAFLSFFTLSITIFVIFVGQLPWPINLIAYALAILGHGILLLWQSLERLSFGPATLTASPWPLSLGAPIRMRFTRKGRGVSINEVRATLQCVERVRYSIGTTSTAVSEMIWSQQLPPVPLPPHTHAADAEWTIIIPADLPASFSASHNTIEWQMIIDQPNDTFRNTQSTFLLHVKPEVASL